MTFTEWVKKETGCSWHMIKELGTDQQQLYRLYDDYDEYCKENGIRNTAFQMTTKKERSQ